MEDEIYSLIFKSLRHPIHRRILRMLDENPLTHSEILDVLNIDSDHLSNHLESLGDLVFKDKTAHYRLSSFGRAAVTLLCGVEHTPTSAQCRHKSRHLLARTYSVVLVLTLVFASVYFLSYVTAVPSDSETTRMAFTLAGSSIGIGETLDLNLTLSELTLDDGTQSIGVSIGSSVNSSHIPNESTFTGWYENSMWLEMEPRKCYTPRDLIYTEVSLNGTSNLTEFSGVFWEQLESMNTSTSETSYVVVEFSPDLDFPIIKFSPDLASTINTTIETSEVANFYLVYLPKLSVNVQTPDGTVIHDFLQRSSEPYFTVKSFLPSDQYWISDLSNTTRFSSSEVPLNQLGVYDIAITNSGPFRWDEHFSLYLKSQRMERPFFYWGVIGLIVALGYLIFAAIGYIQRIKSKAIY